MIVYPLTEFESRAITLATRVLPILAVTVIVLLGAASLASAAG